MSFDESWDEFQKSLHTERFGRQVFFSREVNSTNDWARHLAEMGIAEGTVTIAKTQKAGRGRLDREWISPGGGLWFSIVLRPRQRSSEVAKLVFVASLAVADVLHDKYGLKTETKWPNDVLIKGKKICGILAQMKSKEEQVEFVILGVGVNVNFNAEEVLPEPTSKNATSIERELGRKVPLQVLFRSLLERMENIYDEYVDKGFASLLERWKEHARFLGHHVLVPDAKVSLKGLALDVDCDGALVLKLENGTAKRVLAGDVIVKC